MQYNGYVSLGPRAFLEIIIKRSGWFLIFMIITLGLRLLGRYIVGYEALIPYLYIINIAILLGIFLTFTSFILWLFISWLEYANFKYKLDDEAFKITRGILTREDIALPYRRIKSVDLKRTLYYQILGVTRITIETVTDSEPESDIKADSSDEVLPAIESHLAVHIQEELTKRANVQRMNMYSQKQPSATQNVQ